MKLSKDYYLVFSMWQYPNDPAQNGVACIDIKIYT